MVAEHRAHEVQHVVLRGIAGLVPGDQIPREVQVQLDPALCHDAHVVGRHQEELGHAHDVDHRRMDGDEERCRGGKRGHGQVAHLRRAIDHDDVVVVLDLSDGLLQAEIELGLAGVAPALARHEILGDLMLEVLDVDVARDEIQAFEVRLPHELGHRPPLGAVADCAVQRRVLRDVQFGLQAVKGRERGLRIEVQAKDPIAPQREILREMRGRRRLAGSTLEVGDADDLEVFAGRPVAHVAAAILPVLVEERPYLVHFADRERSASEIVRRGTRHPAVEVELPQVAGIHPDERSGLRGGERAKGLRRVRRVHLLP